MPKADLTKPKRANPTRKTAILTDTPQPTPVSTTISTTNTAEIRKLIQYLEQRLLQEREAKVQRQQNEKVVKNIAGGRQT